MTGYVTLDQGEGGAATSRLVRDLFLRHLGAPDVLEDAAVLPGMSRLALTTDSFVVQPLRFPGGDLGRLAVCGTVNDLAVVGAIPRFLSAAFILEEGLELAILDALLASMAQAATEASVRVVTGDTKVVRAGEADGLYVTTSGVGEVPEWRHLSSANCQVGDQVLVSGAIGDHGTAVMIAREGFGLKGDFLSDCQPVADLVEALLDAAPGTRCMRDPTRGGLATVLGEFGAASSVRIQIEESSIPIHSCVRSACDLLGLDPLYVACEGRVVAVVPHNQAVDALRAMRNHPRGRDAARIGQVTAGHPGTVLSTSVGGLRPLLALEGAQLPRIC